MNPMTLMELLRETIILAFSLATPALVIGMLIGVSISVVQTASTLGDRQTRRHGTPACVRTVLRPACVATGIWPGDEDSSLR